MVSTSSVIVVVIVASVPCISAVIGRLRLTRLVRLLLLGRLLLGRLARARVSSMQGLGHDLVHLHVVIFYGLLKEEVGGVLFIFVACEVGLDGLTL